MHKIVKEREKEKKNIFSVYEKNFLHFLCGGIKLLTITNVKRKINDKSREKKSYHC